jgi:hypothetical protein
MYIYICIYIYVYMFIYIYANTNMYIHIYIPCVLHTQIYSHFFMIDAFIGDVSIYI